jgi:hypothetical protein
MNDEIDQLYDTINSHIEVDSAKIIHQDNTKTYHYEKKLLNNEKQQEYTNQV